jgi:putative redox protein
MEVNVEHIGDVQFEIVARGHRIFSDQPSEAGGHDEGMTPPELMLASLGSCAAYYAVDYLKRNGVRDAGTRVRITADKIKPTMRPGQPLTGARLDNFRIEVTVSAELNEAQHRGVDEAVHHCLIHNTLLNPPSIAIAVHAPVSAV